MFHYLEPNYQEKIVSLNAGEFFDFINIKEAPLTFEDIINSLPESISVADFWSDVIIHYFKIPIPYYLAAEGAFFYLYQLRDQVYQFQLLNSLAEQQEYIEVLLNDTNHYYLAICCSLSLIEAYQAVGHLICINTYEAILSTSAANEKNLYATQIYCHALMFNKDFKTSKKIFKELGWLDNFYSSYGSSRNFVATVQRHVRPFLCKNSKRLAEELAAN